MKSRKNGICLLVVLLTAPMFLNPCVERKFSTDELKIRKIKLLKLGALVSID